jgi:hypothetical protein
MERTMPIARRRRNVPEAIRAKSGMARPDYVDLFTATAASAAARSPEQWARAGIEDAAGFGGQFVWRVLLGLRLAPPASRHHVGGWTIAERGPCWVRLEAASRLLAAHLVVHVQDAEVSIATFIRYRRALAALVWPALAVGHRRAMPGLLRHAVRISAGEPA